MDGWRGNQKRKSIVVIKREEVSLLKEQVHMRASEKAVGSGCK